MANLSRAWSALRSKRVDKFEGKHRHQHPGTTRMKVSNGVQGHPRTACPSHLAEMLL